MPELPEVEHAATRLRAEAVGKTIARAATLHPSLARSLTAASCRALVGRRIVSVTRRAKIQLVALDDGHTLEVHFRMTGDWAFSHVGAAAPRYERVRIECTDGTCISLTDSRAFAVMRLHAKNAMVLPALGPEPLSDEFTTDVFARALSTRRAPIKPVLLDQRVVAGLGNIYAAEALWTARIHPTRVAASLSRARVHALHDAIRVVLLNAPAQRYYQQHDASDITQRDVTTQDEEPWHIYGREGESCERCGATVRRIVQAGRSTFYCGGCQR
jgi:formamidopyrimidine-DNA glycosylase